MSNQYLWWSSTSHARRYRGSWQAYVTACAQMSGGEGSIPYCSSPWRWRPSFELTKLVDTKIQAWAGITSSSESTGHKGLACMMHQASLLTTTTSFANQGCNVHSCYTGSKLWALTAFQSSYNGTVMVLWFVGLTSVHRRYLGSIPKLSFGCSWHGAGFTALQSVRTGLHGLCSFRGLRHSRRTHHVVQAYF